MTAMRAKFRVSSIQPLSDTCERVRFNAVAKSESYPPDGSDENNTFAKWTPSAELDMTITNPGLLGKFAVGQHYYADFTPAP